MEDDDVARRKAAEAWAARLSLEGGDLHDFFAWCADPANRAVWDALEAGRVRVDRFVVRPQTDRYRVVDIWTGETAIIAMTAQDQLSEEDALHTAQLLNRRAAGGDRSVLQ